ncbi:MAG: response regulator [Polyangiaceae bacterium]
MGGSSAVEKRADDSRTGQKEQLGGARADFVANLGRRRNEIAGALDLLRANPGSARHRDDLRRRIHALGAGAKLLRFTALSDELRRLEELLERASEKGALDEEDLTHAGDVLGRMTSLAWGQTGTKTTTLLSAIEPAPRSPESNAELVVAPTSVLVVGKSFIADALTLSSEADAVPGMTAQSFEVENAEGTEGAADLARAFAPDLIVVDADLRGAEELIEELTTDALTEQIPIIVLGKFAKAEDAGKYVALGVARTLPKPVSPGEIRRACANVVSSYVKREVVREPLGSLNVDQLGARLAEELRRGLGDVDARLREKRVELGEGTEIFAALWGAVARIRDVMTIKSSGAVRFQSGGPEGAMPLAPWLGGADGVVEGARSISPRSARAAADVSLQKIRVLVADDDPAVTWFLAGVLKAAGATVFEARDGERAFEIAKHSEPDLVISDILMPRLDGFGLSRALKRDIVLRDVPIILLSWKEDLLQRVRELGADADAYLRKEASAGAVVQRVRELLRERRRVSDRIRTGAEVRGRLDGLTTATLLRIVAETRPNSTVSVRDALYLYEVEMRDGRPARASRTSTSGNFERGAGVFAALLGAGDGRFVVAPAREDEEVGKVRSELSGSLAEQLAPLIATARAGAKLLAGSNLVRIQRVVFDEERLSAYLAATPEPARRILRGLADGTSPRTLVTRGEVAPRLLEDILVDVAAHGIVIEVLDLTGADRLPELTQQELALLRGERAAQPIQAIPVLNMPVLTPAPAAAIEVSIPTQSSLLRAALSPSARPAESSADAGTKGGAPSEIAVIEAAPAIVLPEPEVDVEVEAPLDPLALANGGLGEPWFKDEEAPAAEESPVPSSGPRAVTPPPALVLDTAPVVRTEEPTPTPSRLPPPPGLKPMLTLGSLHPPPVAQISPPPPAATPKEKEKEKPAAKVEKSKTPRPAPVSRSEREKEVTPSAPFVDKRSADFSPSRFLPRSPEPKPKDRKAIYWVLFALFGVGFAVWARWSRNRQPSEDVLIPTATDVPTAEATTDAEPNATANAATEEDDPSKAKPAQLPTKEEESAPEDLPLRDYDKVKKGQGMLEVVAGKSDTIYIDGKARGSGPVQSVPLKAKGEPYEVKVKMRGEERVRFVTVKEGRLTRVRVAPPWTR